MKLLIAVVLMLLTSAVLAHDKDRPELDTWFNGLRSGKGPCCSNSDATVLTEIDWKAENGQYMVYLKGSWHKVPMDAMLDGPNRDGRTLVWPLFGPQGSVMIKCFIPGAMT